MALTLSTTTRNAIMNAVAALFVAGGDVQFRTDADAEVATCDLSAPAFGAASSGAITANAVSDDTSAAGGTIELASIRNGSGDVLIEGSVTVTGGGGDFTGSSIVIAAGETVSVDSLVLTCPAGG